MASNPGVQAAGGETTLAMQFADNGLAQALFGFHHSHLVRIEEKLDIAIHARGNELTLQGDDAAVTEARNVLEGLYERLEKGLDVTGDEVDAALRMSNDGDPSDATITIKTRNRLISPRTASQAAYLRAIDEHELVFAQGPAGTGQP